MFMRKLNEDFGGRLWLAIEIFAGSYHKNFLHQLISGQLDVDRMDYLIRDSYFTGVHEGVIGYDRLIEMMDVADDELIIEHKGIYSVEKFLVARRVMYWQVYLHKTVICAEQMLIKTLKRAKSLARKGEQLFTTPALRYFLYNEFNKSKSTDIIEQFSLLDDSDIYIALKQWSYSQDKVLSYLSNCIINRKLFKIELQNQPLDAEIIQQAKENVKRNFDINDEADLEYYVFNDTTSNSAYNLEAGNINIKFRNGKITDLAQASDHLNLTALSGTVVKHYLCYPKLAN